MTNERALNQTNYIKYTLKCKWLALVLVFLSGWSYAYADVENGVVKLPPATYGVYYNIRLDEYLKNIEGKWEFHRLPAWITISNNANYLEGVPLATSGKEEVIVKVTNDFGKVSFFKFMYRNFKFFLVGD